MGSKSSKPVLWILLWKKIGKKDLLKLGFKEWTINKYNKLMPFVLADYRDAIRKLKGNK